MRISTRGRYGLLLMLDLAMHDSRENVALSDISKRQGISKKYLENIVSVLTIAGYVRAERGTGGGYRLTRRPGEYTTGMILRLLEGGLAPVASLEPAPVGMNREDYGHQEDPTVLKLWVLLNEAINGVVDQVTLADLVRWKREDIVDYVI